MNNLYHSKKKNELSINKEIERIINYTNKFSILEEKNNNQLNNKGAFDDISEDNKNNENNKIETEFYLDTIKYKILYINDYENKKILINVNKSKSNQSKNDIVEESNELNEFKSQIAKYKFFYRKNISTLYRINKN